MSPWIVGHFEKKNKLLIHVPLFGIICVEFRFDENMSNFVMNTGAFGGRTPLGVMTNWGDGYIRNQHCKGYILKQ